MRHKAQDVLWSFGQCTIKLIQLSFEPLELISVCTNGFKVGPNLVEPPKHRAGGFISELLLVYLLTRCMDRIKLNHVRFYCG